VSEAATLYARYRPAQEVERSPILGLVRFLESLVPPSHRLAPTQALGEERAGWMAVRMGGLMGHGMMGPGMMTPARPDRR